MIFPSYYYFITKTSKFQLKNSRDNKKLFDYLRSFNYTSSMKMVPVIVALIFLTTVLIVYSIRKPLNNNLLYLSKSPAPSPASPTQVDTRIDSAQPMNHQVNAHSLHGTVVTFEYPDSWQQVASPIKDTFLLKPVGDQIGSFFQVNDFVEGNASVSAETLSQNSVPTESALLKRTIIAVGGHQAIKQITEGKNNRKIEVFVKDVRESKPSDPSTIISGVQRVFMDIPQSTNSAFFENSFDLMLSTFRYTY